MYTSYFGLSCNPFQLTPDPEFLFLGRDHKKALTYLNYGIVSNTGFILVTGEVGTGKTTLIRKILKGLKRDIKIARVNNTLVNSEQLISMINDDFGIETKGKDKTHMLRDLADFIIDQYAQGNRTSLIIDEAQNLSADLLEEIRLLSNLETDKSKLLQIILLGQPELKSTLAVPELRQLRQRISISCHINPLDRSETQEYIVHRLEIAGNRDAVIFKEDAMDALYASTRGIPRLINIFCDFLLLSAFSLGTKEISVDLVKDVATDLDSESRYWSDTPRESASGDNADMLQAVMKRLDRIETVVGRQAGSNIDTREISAKLADLENIVLTNLERSRPEQPIPHSTGGSTIVQVMLREMEDLKRKLIDLERRQQSAVESSINKPKAFWSRIFN